MNTTLRLLLILMVGAFGLREASAAGIPVRLRCDFFADPLGIDSTNPRLDWVLQASDPSVRGLTQSAYQVLAASSPELIAENRGDLWDSGKVMSDQTYQIPYTGSSLQSDQAVWWKPKSSPKHMATKKRPVGGLGRTPVSWRNPQNPRLNRPNPSQVTVNETLPPPRIL
jgi:alpha-L-rhamnosidase